MSFLQRRDRSHQLARLLATTFALELYAYLGLVKVLYGLDPFEIVTELVNRVGERPDVSGAIVEEVESRSVGLGRPRRVGDGWEWEVHRRLDHLIRQMRYDKMNAVLTPRWSGFYGYSDRPFKRNVLTRLDHLDDSVHRGGCC